MDQFDNSLYEGVKALRQIFGGLNLSPEEKQFVNRAGKELAVHGLELFGADPNARQMCYIVIAVALASILGPPDPGDYGTDVMPNMDTEPTK